MNIYRLLYFFAYFCINNPSIHLSYPLIHNFVHIYPQYIFENCSIMLTDLAYVCLTCGLSTWLSTLFMLTMGTC